jgi:hypothetical protein
MDWTTLAAAFLGGGCGGAVSAVVSFTQLRRDKAQSLQVRRWIDAEIVADATTLLMDLDPERRTINADPTPGSEKDLWKNLNQRKDQLYKQLLLLSVGHPSRDVASAADELGLALLWTSQQTQFAVFELLANRDFLPYVENAKQKHKAADTALVRLTIAAKDAATPKRHLFQIRKQKALDPPPLANEP